MGNLSNFVKRVRDIMRNDAGINGDAQRIEQIAWMLFLKVYDSKEDEWNTTFDSKESYQSIIPESCRWRNWAHAKNGRYSLGICQQYAVPHLEKAACGRFHAHQKSNRADYLCRCKQLYERWRFASTNHK